MKHRQHRRKNPARIQPESCSNIKAIDVFFTEEAIISDVTAVTLSSMNRWRQSIDARCEMETQFFDLSGEKNLFPPISTVNLDTFV